MTDKQICDAIGKQAAIAAVFAMMAKLARTLAAAVRAKNLSDASAEFADRRANHFHAMSLQFTDHTLRLLATHQAVVERQLKVSAQS